MKSEKSMKSEKRMKSEKVGNGKSRKSEKFGKITELLGTKKSHNLWGQKIMQPLGT